MQVSCSSAQELPQAHSCCKKGCGLTAAASGCPVLVCTTVLCSRSRLPTFTGRWNATSSTMMKRGFVPANMYAVANASSYALLQPHFCHQHMPH